jgi:hypothetical protein
MPTQQIIERIRRALSLEQAAFEEVRDDVAFTPFAVGLAAVAILLGGLGAYLWAVFVDVQEAPDLAGKGDFFLDAVILGSIFAALLWLAGVAVIYIILTQVYRETVAPDALFRIAALGAVPFAIGLLVFIPGIGYGIGLLSIALMFFLTVFGLRAAFPSIGPQRVVLAVVAGFAVWALILPLLSGTDNAFTPGAFVFEWSEYVVEEIFATWTD